MKSPFPHAALAVSLLGLVVFTLNQDASARDIVLPAGTLLQCTLNEPNLSTNTMDVGDPVLCHLRGVTEFGQQAFPRGSYLVGHLEAAKDPGHFWGKGSLKLQFDRIGLPTGDLPLEAKVISTKGYKVDKQGKIDGKGHPKRDIVEWMLPPLWPWKVVMLPARGPRPKLKGETALSLRLMDDVSIPQVAQTYGPGWHFFNRMSGAWQDAKAAFNGSQLASRPVPDGQLSYANYVTTEQSAANLASPGMPVFVLNSGTILAVSAYGYEDKRISYTLVGGGAGVISTDDVDWSTTTRVNTKRGVHLTLHASRSTTGSPGM
jgi:hypothetical protein